MCILYDLFKEIKIVRLFLNLEYIVFRTYCLKYRGSVVRISLEDGMRSLKGFIILAIAN